MLCSINVAAWAMWIKGTLRFSTSGFFSSNELNRAPDPYPEICMFEIRFQIWQDVRIRSLTGHCEYSVKFLSSAKYYSSQPKLAAEYRAVSQITSLFNIAVSQNSPLNMWRLVKSRPYLYIHTVYVAAVSQIALLFNMAVTQNSPLNMLPLCFKAASHLK
jgi:hypothetical protein